jgi:hypothetical protein
MTAWTDQQVVAIARRVLADETASDERKEWARAALLTAWRAVIEDVLRARAFSSEAEA